MVFCQILPYSSDRGFDCRHCHEAAGQLTESVASDDDDEAAWIFLLCSSRIISPARVMLNFPPLLPFSKHTVHRIIIVAVLYIIFSDVKKGGSTSNATADFFSVKYYVSRKRADFVLLPVQTEKEEESTV